MSDDPVLARRAQARRLAALGQRIGYTLFLVAVIGFFAGFFAGFEDWIVTVVVAAIVVGSALLAPAIVVGYGVKAADRDDRESGRPT